MTAKERQNKGAEKSALSRLTSSFFSVPYRAYYIVLQFILTAPNILVTSKR